jgi:hypothetical protein
MRHRSLRACAGLSILLLVSCTTNPVTVRNFDADHPPVDALLSVALSLVPGAPQVANGEYLEGTAVAGTLAGSIAAAGVSMQRSPTDPGTFVPRPGYDALALIGVLGIIGSIGWDVIDSFVTTSQRHAQYAAILADPRVLAELVHLEMRDSPPLYAIRYASYGSVPSGTLRLTNLGASKIRQVEVYAQGSYLSNTDQPVARTAELGARSSVDVPLAIRFDQSVAALTEDRTIPLKLTASFRLAGQDQRRSTVGRIVLQGRNAVNWNEPAAIASFIQPDDAPIKAFARDIGARVAELAGSASSAAQDPSLWLKMLASALHVRGLGWFADPLTPFAETSLVKGRADYIQLPRETLRFLGGDADEIAILLSSISEAAGLETAILYRPGMVLVAVRLGLDSPLAGHLRSLSGDDIGRAHV